MKKLLSLIIIFISVLFVPIEAEQPSCTITLKILNNKHNAPFYIAIYDTDKSFLNPTLARYALIIESNEEDIYIINGIIAGNYALVIFQDINQNGQLDKGLFGIPREPYGFSNNPWMLIGPPSYQDCEFTLLDHTTLEIKLK